MGIQITKKATPAAPAAETKAEPVKKTGLTIGKKVGASGPGAGATATVTHDTSNKGKVTDTQSETENVTVAPSSATATDNPEVLCRVGITAQYTHNLGNYNSTKIGVSLSVPCKHDEIDAVCAFVEDWVNSKMQSSVAALQSSGE